MPLLRTLTVFGTRPETIKMAPLIKELESRSGRIANKNCFTGQHKDMVEPLLDLFEIRVDFHLGLMRHNQKLGHITVNVLQQVTDILDGERFDLVIVQGDTTTSMAAAMAAFYSGVPVAHVEAGLRTFNIQEPFPEEVNRRIIDSMSTLFFAHTELARQHLLNEGIDEQQIAVTGNTVIDALLDVSQRSYSFEGTALQEIPFETRKVILVTAHRRESFGSAFESLCSGLKDLAEKYREQIFIVYPVHRNPNVRKVVERSLSSIDNVLLTDPMDYLPLVHLMKRAYLVLTDSGGLQEEVPSLGKPVLVLRNVTERQEGVEAGTVKLVGTDSSEILKYAGALIEDSDAYEQMASKVNPYGDGTAAVRIVDRVLASAQQLQPA